MSMASPAITLSTIMEKLWDMWRTSPSVKALAIEWLTQSEDFAEADEKIYEAIHEDPDTALAVIFAAMQMTHDEGVLGTIGSGFLEDFLVVHGEDYIDLLHPFALKTKRLREVIDFVWQGSMSPEVWSRIESLQQKEVEPSSPAQI